MTSDYPQEDQFSLPLSRAATFGSIPRHLPSRWTGNSPWRSNVATYGVPFELSWNLLHDIVRIGFEHSHTWQNPPVAQEESPPPPPKSGRGHQTLAVEFPNGGISAKAYLFPGMKSLATGMPPGKLILDSIKRLALSGWKEPMHHLCNSLGLQDDGHPTDTAVPPFLLSADLCTPDHCRLKIYVTDQVVSWDRVADT
ncbi:12-alpha,13-alpha-dihydroxyfumitremorgin C prenyltransferase [Aspergillus lentulus]|uniref:12-alpha,13-alpha-dihydroxyfumitremorgin C prenyltransferase n=1 Tax=Aspergillus lentulus TaxID=293939 RepID=A0AAN4TFQ5_ASPLE|nr:12-alpha,13-alpha-dihydroxyfumitremorgin C prenyltransferase [Aspergillus lentulus]